MSNVRPYLPLAMRDVRFDLFRGLANWAIQQETHAPQQTPSSFDHLVGTASQSTETSNNPSIPLISFQSGS
jgi:hypothetical protein